MIAMSKVEVQLKVPMLLTILLDRQDAAWMFRDQLAEVVDALLSQASTEELKEIATSIEITGGHEIDVEYRVDPYLDNTPEDELEFVFVEDDLFPFDGVRDDE
jgi:hypothetical protein